MTLKSFYSNERKSVCFWLGGRGSPAVGKEREEPQIFDANNLLHILVEESCIYWITIGTVSRVVLELSWHCRPGIFIEVSESTSELGPGNWGEQDGGDHAANTHTRSRDPLAGRPGVGLSYCELV